VNLQTLPSPGAARRWCAAARAAGHGLGFVPTMGALHEGHLSLVQRAVRENDLCVVSIFVNPLQFDDPRDLECYPRDLGRDCALLAPSGCALVFTGDLAEFFPECCGGAEPADGRRIPLCDPGPGARGLEGRARAGHFAGVATIVARLFELVRPARAYFGEKDFQQTLVVKHVAGGLGFPEIVVCPTSREPDGLARSSRNVLLSAQARPRAAWLARALFAARADWIAGERRARTLETGLAARLTGAGIELDYAAVRDPERWTALVPRAPLTRARALVAARVGSVRRSANLSLSAGEASPSAPAEARGARGQR
jgi:pantoate--beta-alanine ligase